MTCSTYVPVIKAEFGRTITDEEINNEFQRIEEIMECVCGEMQSATNNVDITNYITEIINTIILSPSDGLIQYMTVTGDVEITLSEPEEDDPRLITLVIANGGDGRFNFATGAAWTSSANGDDMDGAPWVGNGTGGDYGAIVRCIHDGEGWLFIVYARHDIDFTAAAEVTDLYRWR